MRKARTDLFGALAHDNAAPLIILQGAVGMAHHLKHVVDRVIHVPGDGREGRPHSGGSDDLNVKEEKVNTGHRGQLQLTSIYDFLCLGTNFTCLPIDHYSFQV